MATVACPPTIAEHVDILWWVFILLITFLGWLIKKGLNDILTKLDHAISNHNACREELPKEYVSYDVFNRFLDERAKQWDQWLRQNEKFQEMYWKHKHNKVNGAIET